MVAESTTTQESEPVTSPKRVVVGAPLVLVGILTAYLPLIVEIPTMSVLGLSVSVTVVPALLLLVIGGVVVSGLDNVVKNKLE